MIRLRASKSTDEKKRKNRQEENRIPRKNSVEKKEVRYRSRDRKKTDMKKSRSRKQEWTQHHPK